MSKLIIFAFSVVYRVCTNIQILEKGKLTDTSYRTVVFSTYRVYFALPRRRSYAGRPTAASNLF